MLINIIFDTDKGRIAKRMQIKYKVKNDYSFGKALIFKAFFMYQK